MKGQWIHENTSIPKNFEFNFNKIKGKCHIISSNWIQCIIEGFGEFKFSDNYYFEYSINTFMIQKSEKLIYINDCNANNSDNSSVYFIFSQKLFILILLLFL